MPLDSATQWSSSPPQQQQQQQPPPSFASGFTAPPPAMVDQWGQPVLSNNNRPQQMVHPSTWRRGCRGFVMVYVIIILILFVLPTIARAGEDQEERGSSGRYFIFVPLVKKKMYQQIFIFIFILFGITQQPPSRSRD